LFFFKNNYTNNKVTITIKIIIIKHIFKALLQEALSPALPPPEPEEPLFYLLKLMKIIFFFLFFILNKFIDIY
jgi:hypothetical protein